MMGVDVHSRHSYACVERIINKNRRIVHSKSHGPMITVDTKRSRLNFTNKTVHRSENSVVARFIGLPSPSCKLTRFWTVSNMSASETTRKLRLKRVTTMTVAPSMTSKATAKATTAAYT